MIIKSTQSARLNRLPPQTTRTTPSPQTTVAVIQTLKSNNSADTVCSGSSRGTGCVDGRDLRGGDLPPCVVAPPPTACFFRFPSPIPHDNSQSPDIEFPEKSSEPALSGRMSGFGDVDLDSRRTHSVGTDATHSASSRAIGEYIPQAPKGVVIHRSDIEE